MNPQRIDILVDFAYGLLIFVSLILMLWLDTSTGVAFAMGVLFAYGIHVIWKMARYDPEWMTDTVSETVEETVAEEVDEVIDRVEEINERVDRRPRTEDLEETIEELADRRDR